MTKNTSFILDTTTFNLILDSCMDLTCISENEKVNIHITKVQISEINKNKDEQRKEELLNILKKIPHKEENLPFRLDGPAGSGFGQGVLRGMEYLSEEAPLNKILFKLSNSTTKSKLTIDCTIGLLMDILDPKKKSHINDRCILEVAIHNNLRLVTNDNTLFVTAKLLGCQPIRDDSFLKMVKEVL